MNSTVTTETGRSSIEGFHHALARRIQNKKGPDEECVVLAEELLEEVFQQPKDDGHSSNNHRLIQAGEKAIELLNDSFWRDPKEAEKMIGSFPKTRGVLFRAVLDGYEECFNTIGVTKFTQTRFSRFIARTIGNWDDKERTFALLKLREKLKGINPPVCWELVCFFLSTSNPNDDESVIQAMGRTFGHLASQESLALAAKAVVAAKLECPRSW